MKKQQSVRLSEVSNVNGTSAPELPKYASGVINSASGFARATRPENVGMVSQEILNFCKDSNYPGHSLEDWKQWHHNKFGNGIDRAVDEAWSKFKDVRSSLAKVKKHHVRNWIEDLVYNKTYDGLMAQKAIIYAIAKDLNTEDVRLANEEEEHRGIDGFINGKPLQVKSETYTETGKRHNEEINCPVVYYHKENKNFIFEYDTDWFTIN